jgi:hypothetical protein
MDELQRRLRDADPLTAAEGWTPDAMRLDAIKEQIMLTDRRPVRAAFRPRRLGLVGLGAASLVAVLVVGALARPAAVTLAWSPQPTPVSDAQKAAASDACTTGATTVVGGVGNSTDRAPEAPPAPTDLPPLVSLELHGNGGIAILADQGVVAYCLLRSEGGGFVYGGLAVGAPETVPAGSLAFGAMSTDFDGTDVGMIWGTAPDGVTSVRVDGGSGDGGVATVQDGRFAIWIPGPIIGSAVDLVALDASGFEVLRQTLSKGGEAPVEYQATPDPNGEPVEGQFTPAP